MKREVTRRLLVACATVAPLALLFLTAGPKTARGGEYHFNLSLVCSDCHTMHFSLTHSYDGSAGPVLESGPNGKLLKAPGNELCKSCHDGQPNIPDVVGDHGGGYVRQAGGLTTGSAPYEDWKGHTLGSTATAPGGTWSAPGEGLECIHCHGVHNSSSRAATTLDVAGNPTPSNWRNLNPTPGIAYSPTATRLGVSYAKGTNDTTKDVFLRGWTLGDIANNYSVANSDYNEPVSSKSGIGRYCQVCHTNFHGDKTSANMNNGTDWVRHPAADANISVSTFKTKAYRLKVMSPSGDWGTQGTAWSAAPADLTPTCTTCHKAHGNQNPFGLIYLQGTGPITEEGDATGQSQGMRAMCKQCHGMGGAN